MPRRCVDLRQAQSPPRRRAARASHAVWAAGMLALAGCGSAPSLPTLEQYPQQDTVAAPAPAPAAESSPGVVTRPLDDQSVPLEERSPAATDQSAVNPPPAGAPAAAARAPTQASTAGVTTPPVPIAPLSLDSATLVPPAAQQEFERAVAAAQGGDLAAAERAFDTLNAQYPDYAGPLVNLAILRAKAGNLEAAEQALQSAVERNTNSAPVFNQLGVVHRRQGKFKEADAAYQRAIELDPNYANAYYNLGVLCDLYLQQPQRALQAFERYLELAGKPDPKVSGWLTELKARSARSARSEQ